MLLLKLNHVHNQGQIRHWTGFSADTKQKGLHVLRCFCSCGSFKNTLLLPWPSTQCELSVILCYFYELVYCLTSTNKTLYS